MSPLAVIVAMARNGVIGKQGQLPWYVPEDLQFFKTTTMGHALIMGRKTHESIGRPLPGRRNIVVTRGETPAGCERASTVPAAVALARSTDPEPLIIGGSQIYADALPLATRLYLTEIDREVENGDTFLHIDRSQWREVSRRAGRETDVTFIELARIETP